MKLYLTIIAISIFSICSAQTSKPKKGESFVLTGKLIGAKTDFIVLWYVDTSDQYVRDTAFLKNGLFEFKGKINEPSYSHLFGAQGQGKRFSFFLSGGRQTVLFEGNNIEKAAVKGSVTQKENEDLFKKTHQVYAKYQPIEDAFNKVNQVYDNEEDSSTKEKIKLRDQLGAQLDTRNEEVKNLQLSFIYQHPDSYVSATELATLIVVNSYPVNGAKQLYDRFSPRIKASRGGKYCLQEIESRLKLMAGSRLPDLEAKDIHGQNFSLAQLKGKYVLLDFWASWCVPCRKGIPEIKNVYSKYYPKGFEVVAISLDRNEAAWKEAIIKDGIDNWKHLLRSEQMEIFKPVLQIPLYILLDPTGKIIWSSFDENKEGWKEHLAKEFEKI